MEASAGERTTANLCTPGTNVVIGGALFTTHCLNSQSKTYRGEQWVRVEAEVLGAGRITHFVDGAARSQLRGNRRSGAATSSTTIRPIKKDGALLTEGSISLQSESHPVEFRKVELLNLIGCMDARRRITGCTS